jgi:hypothetical protein
VKVSRLAGLLVAVVGAMATAPGAAASAPSFCGDLGGAWDGQYCHMSVLSERKAVRDITVAIPPELVDDPLTGPVVRDYLGTLVDNWRTVGARMAADSFGEGNYQIFRHGDVLTVVFHETYHADGPDFNNAYRTFAFDTRQAKLLALSDLTTPDGVTAIASLGQPYIEDALNQAQPPHNPGTYPFTADRWTPDKVYSGGYKAWALTPDELILYMPDYPVAHDTPINYTPGIMQWSMDGGTVQAHIPLPALSSVLRPEYM